MYWVRFVYVIKHSNWILDSVSVNFVLDCPNFSFSTIFSFGQQITGMPLYVYGVPIHEYSMHWYSRAMKFRSKKNYTSSTDEVWDLELVDNFGRKCFANILKSNTKNTNKSMYFRWQSNRVVWMLIVTFLTPSSNEYMDQFMTFYHKGFRPH